MHRQKFLNYNEAKDYLKNLDIKTQRAYKKWQKENRIKFLPNWANGYYKEWISWNDYLNKKSFAEQILNYNDAKNFVKINLLEKTQRGYIKWQNSNKINFLPSNPSKFYKEWITWADFVSSNTLSNKEISSKLLKYDEAKVLLYKFNMKSSSEYINWFKNINNNVIKVPYKI